VADLLAEDVADVGLASTGVVALEARSVAELAGEMKDRGVARLVLGAPRVDAELLDDRWRVPGTNWNQPRAFAFDTAVPLPPDSPFSSFAKRTSPVIP
jgi:hypothetical protein